MTAPLPKKPEVAAAPVVAPPPPAPEKPVVKPAEDKAPEKPAPVTVADGRAQADREARSEACRRYAAATGDHL